MMEAAARAVRLPAHNSEVADCRLALAADNPAGLAAARKPAYQPPVRTHWEVEAALRLGERMNQKMVARTTNTPPRAAGSRTISQKWQCATSWREHRPIGPATRDRLTPASPWRT